MKKKELIEKFVHSRIMVLGDIMLDKYIFGVVERVSPEAPIPVVSARGERLIPGGAANVANNIKCLGAAPVLVSVVGEDAAGKALLSELSARGISTESVVVSNAVLTTQKIRILSHNQQLLRLDYEEKTLACQDELCSKIRKNISNVDMVIVSDYAKGVVGEKVMAFLREVAATHGKRVIIDPKPVNKRLYSGAYLITPNQREAEELSGIKAADESSIFDMGSKLLELASNVLITRGEKGMVLFSPNETISLPTQAKDVFDVSGAGDTVVAAIGLAVSSGATLSEAADLANHAAGIVVGKVGTATVSPSELVSVFEKEVKKQKSVEELKGIVAALKSQGKKVVFTNGCFDILHTGHVQLLRKAKSFGDVLIVGLNTDESIRRIKGKNRPIIGEDERVEIISALEPVDYVVLFSESDPCKIISELKPSIHVKGGDYDPQDYARMPEAKIVHEYGGTVKIVSLIDGKSTTKIIEKIMSARK